MLHFIFIFDNSLFLQIPNQFFCCIFGLQIYKISVNLWNTSYVVAPGHALRFAVASSNYPRFSVNPNNGVLLADPIYPGIDDLIPNKWILAE